jgi:hypothetical protein
MGTDRAGRPSGTDVRVPSPIVHWRFDRERDRWHGELEQNQHTTAHRAILALCILLFALLAFEGWHILTYLKPPWE